MSTRDFSRYSPDYTPAWRDRVAWRLATVALKIASPWYRAMIGGSIEYGLRAAKRDSEIDTPSPGPWRTEEARP